MLKIRFIQKLYKIEVRIEKSRISGNYRKGSRLNKKKIKSGAPNRIFERYSKETIIKLAVIIKV
jgi:hypothetical protein